MKRYAQNTSVSISKSRGEIDNLLRSWGAIQIQWSDDFEDGKVMLRFVWPREEGRYQARLMMQLPTDADLKKEAVDGRNGQFSQGKFSILQTQRGRQEHRVLLLWLKAALNAVEINLISAEALFLPFLEGSDGHTVAEVALPKLAHLMSGSALLLLPGK